MKKARFFMMLAGAIMFIAQFAHTANACAFGMYEREIPEALK